MSQSARKRKLNATIVIPALPVRNPFIALAHQRQAGKHEVSKSTQRRKAARAARVEAQLETDSRKGSR
jgi:hypothetical protein